LGQRRAASLDDERRSIHHHTVPQPRPESAPREATKGEILVPHDPDPKPVTGVRNVLVQSSLTQLQQRNYYDRYRTLIDPAVLQELHLSLGPGWIPIALAEAHYAACDRLQLTAEEIAQMGYSVGDRVQETTLVSTAKNRREAEIDLWSQMPTMHRMWPRIYQGGSVQIAKRGPKVVELELLGHRLGKYAYFRQATLTAIAAAYVALGVRVDSTKVVSYSAARDELLLRLAWT
jgi:hypothetical protein